MKKQNKKWNYALPILTVLGSAAAYKLYKDFERDEYWRQYHLQHNILPNELYFGKGLLVKHVFNNYLRKKVTSY